MLNADNIIAEAEAATGIADTDAGVRANLTRLVDELNATFPMHDAGLARTHGQFLNDTVNRLAGLKFCQDYPDILAEPIGAPVFLMGLPRSGTTYFQYLFDRDPRFRLIRTWESQSPSPPPHFDLASAAQRKAGWAERRAREHPAPDAFNALHLIDEDGSDECHAFLEQSFGAVGLHNLFSVPDFFDYLMDEADLTQTYHIHKRQLQLLQWRAAPKPWALKYPNHLIATDAILRVYPDARFVMTHRDPLQTLASICKMTLFLRSMRAASPPDPRQIGQHMLHFITRHIERIMAFDAGPHARRIIHVDYYALIADPVREMRLIHRGLGINTPEEVAKAVGDWHAANPKNARGANDYSLVQFGLNADAVAEQFAAYIKRFAIPSEAMGLSRT